MKKAAIIIATYNAGKYIKPLLASLSKQDYPKDDFRIFIIDNFSTDDTIVRIKHQASDIKQDLNVEIIRLDKNLGFASGNNVGTKQAIEAGYEYIVLLNQDMEVDEHWLSEMAKKAESSDNIGAVQSMMILANDRDEINSTGERLNYLGIGYSGNYQLSIINYQPDNNVISYASGAAVLYKSEVLRKVGLFDESFFMYHEDSDLSWRIRLAGFGIELAEQSICYHDYHFNRNPNTFYLTEKNRLAFLVKNYELKTLLLVFPMFIVMEAGMLAYALVTGWLWQKVKSYSWFFRNFGKILSSRKEIQGGREVSDKELKKYLVAGIEFGGLENWVLKYIANPVLKVYWFIARKLI